MNPNHRKNVEMIKNLYYNKGFSMREVSEYLGVSWGSVLYLMRKYNLSRRTPVEDNALRFKKKPLSFKVKENLNSDEKILKAAGVLLYWAEGSKWKGEQSVDFANSDYKMIKVFLRFLREICRVDEERLRVYLYCYANQNVGVLTSFWSSLTGIPKKQFTKPYIKKDFNREKIGKMKMGLIHIRYSDKKLLSLLREWIGYYSESLGR